MKTIKECCFCNVKNGKYVYPDVDVPFASDNNYFAVASIGALVEGWSLVIPRNHCMSLKHLYSTSQLENFLNGFLPKLHSRYGRIIAFEHGANVEDSLTGCGTNHAHLHLVPFSASLLPELKESELLWEPCKSSQIAAVTKAQEYLFYVDLPEADSWKDPVGQLHLLRVPQSQYFRKLIAQKLGVPANYNYKTHPNRSVAAKTQKVLAAI